MIIFGSYNVHKIEPKNVIRLLKVSVIKLRLFSSDIFKSTQYWGWSKNTSKLQRDKSGMNLL